MYINAAGQSAGEDLLWQNPTNFNGTVPVQQTFTANAGAATLRLALTAALDAGHLGFGDFDLQHLTDGVVIRRSTYMLAGQAVAVRVTTTDPDGDSGLHYLYSDHLGSASAVQKDDGSAPIITRYLPLRQAQCRLFGGYRGGSGPNQVTDRGFTGQPENMDLGLYYYQARFYVPGIGRFASADTVVPDPTNPQSYNRYSYVRNRTLNLIDPSGFWDCTPGNDYQRCVTWITDLLEMLKNDGGDVAYGLYLWFMSYDSSLSSINGTGVVFEVISSGTIAKTTGFFNFDMKTRGYDTIQITQGYFNKAVDHRKAALLGHEITHLFHGPAIGLSELGEISAYNVQATILKEFDDKASRLSLPRYANLGLGPNLQQIYDTIQAASGSFSSSELTHLRTGLAGLGTGYRILPTSPALIGFDNHPSNYSLVVEPIRVFTNLAYIDAISPNGIDRGVR